jgi:ankyrin repeat protein
VMWAARNGNADVAAALYATGAKPGAKNLAGLGPVGVAAQACQLKVIPELVKGGESEDAGPVAAGRCKGWLNLFQNGAGLLQVSLQKGTADDVETALALDSASVNKEDLNGYLPLHVAAGRGDVKLVSALLNSKAAANSVAPDGNTALMLAAAKGCLDCVRRLLPYIDDINLKNVDGESALYLAVRSQAIDVVKELRDAGASEASRTIGRDTPEKLAKRLGDKALLDAVAN